MGNYELSVAALAGGTISYRQAGAGPDLVFLHGLASNSRSWAHQFRAFENEFRVTAWDAPGFGKSDPIDPDLGAYGASLASLFDDLGITDAVLLGHSMGGIVAADFAARYPGRVRALVLSCTFLGRRQSPGSPLGEGYAKRIADLETLAAMDYGRVRARAMAAPGCDPETLERLAEIAAETPVAGLANAARVIWEADNGAAAASLAMPVLVLAGAEDRTVTSERTDELMGALPDGRAERVTLPGVGHAPYMEDPAAYTEALRAFLDRVIDGSE